MMSSMGAHAGWPLVALLLSSCVSSHQQAKPDADKADTGTVDSPGPEDGPEVSALPSHLDAEPDVSALPSRQEVSPEVSVLPSGSEAGPDVPVLPSDPESCAKAPNVPVCEPGAAIATISSATGGSLLAKVSSGLCVATCSSGCALITVLDTLSPVGATCDLEVTSMDGRIQSVRLTVVQNPVPVPACCSNSAAPYSGHWVDLDPTTFSPSSVVVDFSLDGGVPSADSGIDSSSKSDIANLDADKVDADAAFERSTVDAGEACGTATCQPGEFCVPGCIGICYCPPAPDSGICPNGACGCGAHVGCAYAPPSYCSSTLPMGCQRTDAGQIQCMCA
jgi:hypothetical protein